MNSKQALQPRRRWLRDPLDALILRVRKRWNPWVEGWVRRRARATPPVSLAYRQIFILPTRFGWLLALLMVGMLLGSLNFNNNLGLLTTFIVVSLAHSSLLMAYRNLRGLQFTGTAALPVHAGEDATLRIAFRNSDPVERPGLIISCCDRSDEFDLEAASTGEIDLPITTQQRGWMNLPKIEIRTVHPTGLFQAWSYVWSDRSILVWPRPAENAPGIPSGNAQADGQRFRREPEGENFYSLRNWRAGDPLHRVAWKASQRHGTLLAREFRNEESDHLDLDLAEAPAHDIEARISILTAWVLQASRQGCSWTLRAGGRVLGPDRGDDFAHECLNLLAEL